MFVWGECVVIVCECDWGEDRRVMDEGGGCGKGEWKHTKAKKSR